MQESVGGRSGVGSDRAGSFTALYRDHVDRVHAYLARRAAPDVADEVVSDVFLVAWQRLDAVPAGRELPWLYGVARNCLANRVRADHRRDGRERASGDDAQVLMPDFAGGIAERDALRSAMATLTDSDREILMLVAWEDLTPAEAAQALGITATSARVRLHRARDRFARAYRGGLEDADSELTEVPR